MMKNVENRILYHTHDPRYGQKSAASSKNGKFFVTYISVYYFALKPSESDEKCRKPNFYHTHDPRYGPKSPASSKKWTFLVTDFSVFYFAVKPSKNDEKCRKAISFITPMTRDMDKKELPAVKMGKFLSPIFLFFILL